MFTKTLSIGILLLCCAMAFPSVLFVTQGESIQQIAIASIDGDTLILEHGIFDETVVLTNRSLTIGSRFVLDGDTSHISETIITPNSTRPDTNSCLVFTSNGQSAMRLLGLTIVGGTGTRFNLQGEFLIGGGALAARNQSIEIRDCRINVGTADIGGGVFVFSDTSLDTATALISNSRISGCHANSWGGGIYSNYSDISIYKSEISECSSEDAGGGLISLAGTLRMDSCIVHSCFGLTGGVYASPIEGAIRGCVFRDNGNSRPESFHGTCHLKALGEVIVSGNLFTANATSDEAVSISSFGGWGRDFFTGNIIEHHMMTDFTGAMYTFDCEGDITYNIFRDNYGDHGASVVPTGGGNLRIHHNVFRDNEIGSEDSRMGSAITINEEYNSFFIDSNLFVGNQGAAIGYVTVFQAVNVRARYNWWGNVSGPYHAERNPSGQGDTLFGDRVVFDPWLTSIPDTSQISPVGRDRNPRFATTWELLPIYPNPFNSELSISIAGIMGDGFSLKLYDTLGREVATLLQGRGHGQMVHYTAPRNLAAGVYFLRAAEEQSVETRKVVFLK